MTDVISTGVSELLNKRSALASQIMTKSRVYIDYITDTLKGLDIAGYNINVTTTIISTASFANSADSSDPLTYIIALEDIYNQYDIVDTTLDKIMSLMHNSYYDRILSQKLSSTKYHEVTSARNYAIDQYEIYRRFVIDSDASMMELITPTIGQLTDKLYQRIMTDPTFSINRFTIHLLELLIKTTTGERRRKLELTVEKQKSKILGASRLDISKWTGVQRLMVRYNLIPQTTLMKPADLIKHICDKLSISVDPLDPSDISDGLSSGIASGSSDIASISVTDNLFKQLPYSIVIIDRSTLSPIEFNLSGLIDEEYIIANDMKTKPTSGLNKKVITRFATAIMQKIGPPAEPTRIWPANDNLTQWIVFETINGELYRVLGKNKQLVTSGDSIVGILQGVSLRAQQYNDIAADTILQRYADRNSQMVHAEYKAMKHVQISSEPLKNKIVTQMLDNYDKWYTANTPKSVKEFKRGVIDIPVINKIILQVLTDSLGTKKAITPEYAVTYVAAFDSIIRQFTQELERSWIHEPIKDTIYRELTKSDLKDYYRGIFISVVTAAANALDKTNIWTDYDMSLKEFFLEYNSGI